MKFGLWFWLRRFFVRSDLEYIYADAGYLKFAHGKASETVDLSAVTKVTRAYFDGWIFDQFHICLWAGDEMVANLPDFVFPPEVVFNCLRNGGLTLQGDWNILQTKENLGTYDEVHFKFHQP